MKAIIVLAFLVATVLSETITPSPELEEKFKKCKVETGVSDEIAKKVKLHELDFDDANGKCLTKCLCRSSNWCDENLKLNTDKLEKKTKIDPAKLHAARDLCNGLTGADDCDTTFKRFQCFFKEVPETPIIAKS